MQDFVAYPSRWRIGLLLLVLIALVAMELDLIGVFGPPAPSYRHWPAVNFAMNWLMIIFFGMGALSFGKMLFAQGEELRIGTTGIRGAQWSDQTIPWSEITHVTTWTYWCQKTIILHLRNPALYPGRGLLGLFGKSNRALTGGAIGISLLTTDRSYDEAVSAIERFRGSA